MAYQSNRRNTVTLEERVSRLEGAYEQVGSRLDSLDSRLIEVNQSISVLREEMNSRMNALLTVVIGSWATLVVGIIAALIALFTTR